MSQHYALTAGIDLGDRYTHTYVYWIAKTAR
jgi:hypothetical protein